MAKEITVDLNVEATAAQKALEKFGGTLEDVHGEGVQPLNFAIGELEDRLYEMASAGQQNTKEFKEMSAEVGKMKKVIIDTDLAVDGMSQTMAQKVGGSLGGVTAGFELATGAMGAFGVDSEQVEAALLRVQSAMAISQGLQGIKESISSFRALGAVIKSTTAFQWLLNVAMSLNPIGLILAGVVAIGAAIYALWSPIKKLANYFLGVNDNLVSVNGELLTAVEAADKLAKMLEKNNKALNKLIDASRKRGEQALELLEAEGASEEDLYQQKLKNLKSEETYRKASMAAAKLSYEQQKIVYDALLKDGETERAKTVKEELVKYKEKIAELKTLDGDYYHNKEILEAENQKRLEQARKDNLAKYKQHLSDRLAAQREIEDKAQELRRDDAKRIEQLRLRELEDNKNDSAKNAEEKRIREQQINQQYNDQELANASEFFELKKIRTIEQEREIAEIEIGYTKKKEEEKKRLGIHNRAEDAQNFVANQDFKFQIAKDGFQAIGDLANAFAGESEKAQRKAFQINKIAGIAQATIETVQGASKAFVSQLIPGDPTSVVRASIAAAVATASGVARVATIAKTQFGGGSSSISSSGGGGSIPSAQPRPANFNVVGNTGSNQLAETLGSTPLKAYVVGADVTTQQNLDRNKVNTASL